MPERLDLLGRNAFFRTLTSGQLSAIAPLTRCLRFAPGEAVVVEGEEGHAMFQVVRGSLEVLKRLEDGTLKAVAQLGEGAVFGEMSVFNEEPRSATVRARSECVLLEVERDDLRPVLEGNPQLVEQLALLISERRAQLSHLSVEGKNDQRNQLVAQMLQMFSSLKGR
jgi:CRP-like cAMP-binding protein